MMTWAYLVECFVCATMEVMEAMEATMGVYIGAFEPVSRKSDCKKLCLVLWSYQLKMLHFEKAAAKLHVKCMSKQFDWLICS